jgi:hypothetical protein
MKGDPLDPKGLIAESFRIDGIGASECRSIFLDWALSLPEECDQHQSLKILCERYAGNHPDHPMVEVLQSGLTTLTTPRRRGGWRGRARD